MFLFANPPLVDLVIKESLFRLGVETHVALRVAMLLKCLQSLPLLIDVSVGTRA